MKKLIYYMLMLNVLLFSIVSCGNQSIGDVLEVPDIDNDLPTMEFCYKLPEEIIGFCRAAGNIDGDSQGSQNTNSDVEYSIIINVFYNNQNHEQIVNLNEMSQDDELFIWEIPIETKFVVKVHCYKNSKLIGYGCSKEYMMKKNSIFIDTYVPINRVFETDYAYLDENYKFTYGSFSIDDENSYLIDYCFDAAGNVYCLVNTFEGFNKTYNLVKANAENSEPLLTKEISEEELISYDNSTNDLYFFYYNGNYCVSKYDKKEDCIISLDNIMDKLNNHFYDNDCNYTVTDFFVNKGIMYLSFFKNYYNTDLDDYNRDIYVLTMDLNQEWNYPEDINIHEIICEKIPDFKNKTSEIIDSYYYQGKLVLLIGKINNINTKENDYIYQNNLLAILDLDNEKIEKLYGYSGDNKQEVDLNAVVDYSNCDPLYVFSLDSDLLDEKNFDEVKDLYEYKTYSIGDEVIFKKTIDLPLSSDCELLSPVRFVAVKPKQLVFSESGVFYYSDNNSLKKINRLTTIDLETFALSSEHSDISFKQTDRYYNEIKGLKNENGTLVKQFDEGGCMAEAFIRCVINVEE